MYAAALTVCSQGKVKPVVACCSDRTARTATVRLHVAVTARVKGTQKVHPVVRVLARGELSRFRLSDNDCSGVDEALHYRGSGICCAVEGTVVTTGCAGGDSSKVEDVFDSNPLPTQRFLV